MADVHPEIVCLTCGRPARSRLDRARGTTALRVWCSDCGTAVRVVERRVGRFPERVVEADRG